MQALAESLIIEANSSSQSPHLRKKQHQAASNPIEVFYYQPRLTQIYEVDDEDCDESETISSSSTEDGFTVHRLSIGGPSIAGEPRQRRLSVEMTTMPRGRGLNRSSSLRKILDILPGRSRSRGPDTDRR